MMMNSVVPMPKAPAANAKSDAGMKLFLVMLARSAQPAQSAQFA